jgi:hypothetical protein
VGRGRTSGSSGDAVYPAARPCCAGLNPAAEIKGKRGDLLLAHFLLGHNKGGNMAAEPRRTIYYRLAAPGHAARWESTFLDPRTEFAPVRRALDR